MVDTHEHGDEPVKRRSIILKELKEHAPFTALGALSGIVIMAMVVVFGLPHGSSELLFDVLHPAHVALSAVVTAALYRHYKRGLVLTVVVGYLGSVGLGTLSDIILPYLGGTLVGAEMHFHLSFIEHWWLVNPVALLGIALAIYRPRTKLPHSGHVFLSTWASLFYLTGHGEANWLPLFPVIFLILFVAVWVPCCLSDIVFPLLFVGRPAEARHGHTH